MVKNMPYILLPYFSKEDRMKYALIATGEALHVDYYEGLHDRVLQSSTLNGDTTHLSQSPDHIHTETPEPCSEVIETSYSLSTDDMKSQIVEAESKLKNTFEYLKSLLNNSERSLVTGILKFTERIEKLPLSKLPTVLHEFGNEVADNALKRKSKSKIAVQPGSLKHRKSEGRSRQKQSSGRKPSLKKPSHKRRRPHKFAVSVRNKEAIPNKSRTIMGSKSKSFYHKS